MGVNLPKDTTLAGFRLTQVKQALKAYARTGQEVNFFEVKSFAPSRMEAAALNEELLERKLINPDAVSHEHHLTEAGLASAGGKARRSPRSTALRVLDDLLARIVYMNEQSEPLNLVERVWLFGSLMHEQETVGDIDLAIETIKNPAFGDGVSRSNRLRELVAKHRITSSIISSSTGMRSEETMASADIRFYQALISVRTNSRIWEFLAS